MGEFERRKLYNLPQMLFNIVQFSHFLKMNAIDTVQWISRAEERWIVMVIDFLTDWAGSLNS